MSIPTLLQVIPKLLLSFSLLTWRRKWQPTPVFLPGESQGQGSLVGYRLWGHTESDTTEHTCVHSSYLYFKHEVFKELWILCGLPLCGLPFCGLPLWPSWQRIHLQCGRPGFDPWVGKIPWRRERLPIPVFWPGEFYGLYSPWGRKELDMTEQLSFSVIRVFPVKVKWSEVAQSCLTLCDPMDCSLPGSSVHGIFQALVLEWIAISFSRVSFWPRDRT